MHNRNVIIQSENMANMVIICTKDGCWILIPGYEHRTSYLECHIGDRWYYHASLSSLSNLWYLPEPSLNRPAKITYNIRFRWFLNQSRVINHQLKPSLTVTCVRSQLQIVWGCGMLLTQLCHNSIWFEV